MLSAQNLNHGYGKRQILTGVSLALEEGEVVGLGGVSGAGKSTLGCILAGRFLPDAGRILLDGSPLPQPRPGQPVPVQYAPQSAELAVDPRWPVRRILENGGPPDARALSALGIQPAWAERLPAQLSGGQLARVSLARLFHPQLKALICDEITSQLDALEQQALLQAMLDLCRARGIAVLLISHSKGLRSRFADRNLILKNGRLG